MNDLLNAAYNNIPGMTFNYTGLAVVVVGFMGGLALMYGVLLEEEKRQDAVFVVGAASLFVYALVRHDPVIAFAMAGIFLLAGRELVQMVRGHHRHSDGEVKKYEQFDVKK